MKMIINGKKYDTETATAVGMWDNERYGDFTHCREELHRKRTGEYFLYGQGGPMSKYSRSNGNTTSGADDIIPLTEAEARAWAEKKLSADEYEKIFGEVEE
ncbi:MAG: hypothetical protein IIX44_03760 [Clostridia bacterium]|nr:hypothetical protein [Clostridia bacterium]